MKTDVVSEFVRSIERSTGKSIEELRTTPIDKLREAAERKIGKAMTFKSYHDRFMSHEEIDLAFRRALQK